MRIRVPLPPAQRKKLDEERKRKLQQLGQLESDALKKLKLSRPDRAQLLEWLKTQTASLRSDVCTCMYMLNRMPAPVPGDGGTDGSYDPQEKATSQSLEQLTQAVTDSPFFYIHAGEVVIDLKGIETFVTANWDDPATRFKELFTSSHYEAMHSYLDEMYALLDEPEVIAAIATSPAAKGPKYRIQQCANILEVLGRACSSKSTGEGSIVEDVSIKVTLRNPRNGKSHILDIRDVNSLNGAAEQLLVETELKDALLPTLPPEVLDVVTAFLPQST